MAKNIIFVPNSSCGPCVYCDGVSEFTPEDLLRCDDCRRSVHITCLKTGIPKSRLLGDNFFKLTCAECSETSEEVVTRVKLSIVHTLLLTLYNLHKTEESSSREGHFHYKNHVYNFIKLNWKELFCQDGKTCQDNLKMYPNIISGQLSQCSYFISLKAGTGKGRGGWYKLISVVPPTHIIHNFTLDYSRMPKRKVAELDIERLNPSNKMSKKCDSEEDLENLSESLKDTNTSHLKEDQTEDSSIDSLDDSSKGSWFLDSRDIFSNSVPVNIFDSDEELKFDSEKLASPESQTSSLSTTSQNQETTPCEPTTSKETLPSLELRFSSLFEIPPKDPIKTKDKSRQQQRKNKETNQKLVPMSIYEERKLLKKLNARPTLPRDDYYLRRKLIVRETKRQHNLSVFNLDQEYKFLMENKRMMTEKERLLYSDTVPFYPDESTVLDRYQVPETTLRPKSKEGMSFRMMLTGSEGHFESIYSPYSKRMLKSVIWQDFKSVPRKLKLLMEILEKSRKRNNDPTPVSRKPINYYYVTTKHIPTMNYMARKFFWPGIELSEVLQYPDFTCVAMYGQLMIGFGVLIPHTNPQESYISFLLVHPEWRNAGIGKFMLYHLIQTSPGKDITLHVSCTNPALIMYQDFGFKVEEFLENFYDKYLPFNSPECSHAFFIRLNR